MRIAVQGCCHGALDKIYKQVMLSGGADLLLICGDFQSIRNLHDLSTMAVPDKYKKIGNFYEYYSGKRKAPIPTIFIGGNHEASNYLHELFYGGWVCPNIYYIGNSGVVQFGGLRIGGMSGIFIPQNYENGYYEHHPLKGIDVKTAYRVRKNSFFKLSLIQEPVDIMLSHDWPRGITKHGDEKGLLKIKGYLKNEIKNDTFGNPPATILMNILKPTYWFAAHMHVRFEATVQHCVPIFNPDQIEIEDSSDEEQSLPPVRKNLSTFFLSLDKCLPNRHYLEYFEIQETGPKTIRLDPEWIAILRATERFQSFERLPIALPDSESVLQTIRQDRVNIRDISMVPPAFRMSAPAHDPNQQEIGSERIHISRSKCVQKSPDDRVV
jgi:lariat debranching enzyme